MAKDESYVLGPFVVYYNKVVLGEIVMAEGKKAARAFAHAYKLGLEHKSEEIRKVLGCV
jgi:hypothetical protein